MKDITSIDNPLIKKLKHLRKSGYRRKNKEFLVDGYREIAMALDNGLECIGLFHCGFFDNKPENKLFDLNENLLAEIDKEIFSKVCYKENPDGFLAIFKQIELGLSNLKLSDNPLIVVLEELEKPGNLGAIIRTAAAAGVDAIILDSPQTDIYNPNVIRSSEGQVFSIPVIKAEHSNIFSWLKDREIKSFGAMTEASEIYTKADFTGPSAIILGSEAFGLTKKWTENLDESVLIPMKSGMDSLNVSVAGAILIYEALRQRT